MHALIIEDSILISMMVEDHLGELGYTSFAVADNQADAIAMALEQRPDLITADDGLVEGSGIAAVSEICAEEIIPTVFILGDPQKAQESGAPDHACVIAKPFLFDTFRDAVSNAIEKAALARARD
ncbi:MAG: response regulator [Sphingomonadales bacterium]|nr:response regulator [Sphingomonadales bacterium]MDE2172063.1 response regulator [Sphingomonadales bacterium]